MIANYVRKSDGVADAVVPWVSGQSAVFRERARRNAPRALDMPKRFVEHGELRFCLRGITQNLPWIDRVFLVTAEEIPPYINVEFPSLRIVRHDEFIDSHDLPTFNSLAIEANMHRIPGLRKHFVYFNDDFICIRPLDSRQLSFKDGLGAFRLTKQRFDNLQEREGWPASLERTDKALTELFGSAERTTFAHTPQWFDRDACFQVAEAFSTFFSETSASKLRSSHDVYQRLLYTYWVIYKRQGFVGAVTNVSLEEAGVDFHFPTLAAPTLSQIVTGSDFLATMANKKPHIINVVDDGVSVSRSDFFNIFSRLLPGPSPFEVGGADASDGAYL